MEPWIFYLVGLVITIITSCLMDTCNDIFNNLDVTSKLNWEEKIIVMLISISVIIVGGMTAGGFLAWFIVMEIGILGIILLTAIVAIFTYGVGSWVLRFDVINRKSRIFFKAIFLISILFWGYFLSMYYRNIETVEEKKLESKKVEEVVYFSIRDSNINCLYYNENGDEEYVYVNIDDAKIDVDEDREEAYVEIYSYTVTKKKINNNNGKEEVLNEVEVRKYDFYLNSKVMK